ncbi:hypothetical protein A2892_03390 [Candidatus Woesebacteria bacterium RIFCSPLOWO2_01_FULL_39_10b]|uniref:TrbL/VirB6 plasmid conjugal transfer protein n=1 Tax=Candidatus Woesebacteria bacterium RIFCSPLOWO2_01_FULL_39_10b TaxID=1802517 RepID=A0A1F8BAD8_9BACT|nr:MAG: hypothetical protein A2892_03390 [Candidatus Woesebacteria bacterium RIFCSPLOWO2_01_FULL_39_10b]
MFKKLLLSLLISLVLLVSISVPYAKAQGDWYDQSFEEWYLKVYSSDISPSSQIFGERYTAAQVQWILYSFASVNLNLFPGRQLMVCFFSRDLSQCAEPLEGFLGGITDIFAYDTGKGHFYAQGKDKSLLAKVFEERSFSGIGYLRQKARNLHLIPEAKAQGLGFTALNPLQTLWKGARDISYIFFVLISIFFAFAIMFRMRLFSPQAAVTVQSAIPRIAIALILVTFSYAIAGFLVDLVYVTIGLIALLIDLGLPQGALPIGESARTIYNFLAGQALPGGGFTYLIFYALLFMVSFSMAILGFILENLVNFVLAPFAILFAIIVMIVVIILVIILAFRIPWMLIKALANIYLLVIVAPIQITLGAVSNRGGFGSWVRSMIANLAIFPATGALLYLSFIFLFLAMWQAAATVVDESFVADFINMVLGFLGINLESQFAGFTGGWSPPLLPSGSGALPLLYCFVSLIIMTMIPKIGDIIKSLFEGRPFGYGAAIGEALGPAYFVRSQAQAPIQSQVGHYIGSQAQAAAGKYTGWKGKLVGGAESWARRGKYIQ